MERDRLFTERLRLEVDALGLAWIEIDGSQSADELAARIAKHLFFSSSREPGI